jgi:RNA recognition motif-containing protein
MTGDAEAERAISSLNGQELDGRNLTINEARPKEDRGGFGGGRGNGAPRQNKRW